MKGVAKALKLLQTISRWFFLIGLFGEAVLFVIKRWNEKFPDEPFEKAEEVIDEQLKRGEVIEEQKQDNTKKTTKKGK